MEDGKPLLKCKETHYRKILKLFLKTDFLESPNVEFKWFKRLGHLNIIIQIGAHVRSTVPLKISYTPRISFD